MTRTTPQRPEIERDDPASPPTRPEVKRPADEAQPASHPDLDRTRPQPTEMDQRNEREGLAADLRGEYDAPAPDQDI